MTFCEMLKILKEDNSKTSQFYDRLYRISKNEFKSIHRALEIEEFDKQDNHFNMLKVCFTNKHIFSDKWSIIEIPYKLIYRC